MKEYMGNARNISHVLADDGTTLAAVEIILVVSEPRFEMDPGGGGLVRRRTPETIRFVIHSKELRRLAEQLVAMADDADDETSRLSAGAPAAGGGEAADG